MNSRNYPQYHAGLIMVAVMLLLSSLASCKAQEDQTYKKFVSEMTEIQGYADEYSAKEMIFQAQYLHSFAGSSISALRFAIDNILYAKSESPDTSSDDVSAEYYDWDTIAAVNYASPYADYFEGLLHQINDEPNEAKECYQKAMTNSHFPQMGISFSYLEKLDIEKLKTMRDELVTLENTIYSSFTPDPNPIERNLMNFNDEYLRAMAKDTLKNNPEDYETAEQYYNAALLVNPFNTNNYSALAVLKIYMGDIDSAIYYTNQGLWFKEDDELLNRIATILQG